MFLKTLLVGSVAALSLWMGTAAASSKIIYIPLDNRPVNLEYTTDTAKSAGFPLTVPRGNTCPEQKLPATTKNYGNGLKKKLRTPTQPSLPQTA